MSIKTFLLATTIFAVTSPALAQQSQTPSQASTQAQRPSPFERADANKDGVMTLDEVRTARSAAFTRLDVNRDGFLVQSEMPTPRQDRRPGRPDDRQGKSLGDQMRQGSGLMTTADTNRDGTITRSEYDAAWSRLQSARVTALDAAKSRSFARLDRNNDGTITRVETEAGRGAQLDTNNDQRVSLGEWLARPNPLFERGDANKDGRVTREEAAAIVRQVRGEGGRNQRPK